MSHGDNKWTPRYFIFFCISYFRDIFNTKIEGNYKIMFKSIKSKFIILSVLFITLSVGIPLHFLVKQFRMNFEQRSELLLSTTLDMLYYGLDNAMMVGPDKDVQGIIEQINSMAQISHIRIFKQNGEILYSNDSTEINKNLHVLYPNHIIEQSYKTNKRQIKVDENRKAYAAFEPILNKPICQQCHNEKDVIAYLDVDSHLTQAEINFYTGTFHLIFLGVAVIGLLIIGFILLFNHFINNHIQSFIKALTKVEEGNLNTRLPASRKDEFGVLNRHFNSMVDEIQYSREQIEVLHFEQLRHVKKLVTVGELTAQISHEINNYIAIIFSRTDYLLLEALRLESIKKFKPDLEVIQNQITKISKITGNILRHSKKLSSEFKEIDLVTTVNQSLQILEPFLPKKKIMLERNFTIENAFINGDSQQIEELVINLVNNAVDSIERDGFIKIKIFENNSQILLEIRDSGAGITQEIIKNIFSPFFTTKEDGKGTGLGLYIVKNICKNHKAEILVDSKINVGTGFIISFPKLKGK